MTKRTLEIALPADLYDRLVEAAERSEVSVERAAQLAIEEFLAHWEDYQRVLADIDSGADQQLSLHLVNE